MAWTNPKTWTVGEVLSATDMNTYVRDNTDDLKSTKLDDGGTATATISVPNLVVEIAGSALAAAGTVTVDFAGNGFAEHSTLSGNVTYTGTNYGPGRSVTIRVPNGGTLRSLTFPGDWVFVGTKPASIAASKTGVLALTSFGTAATEVVAAWSSQL